jgi:hypothetical protein
MLNSFVAFACASRESTSLPEMTTSLLMSFFTFRMTVAGSRSLATFPLIPNFFLAFQIARRTLTGRCCWTSFFPLGKIFYSSLWSSKI